MSSFKEDIKRLQAANKCFHCTAELTPPGHPATWGACVAHGTLFVPAAPRANLGPCQWLGALDPGRGKQQQVLLHSFQGG